MPADCTADTLLEDVLRLAREKGHSGIAIIDHKHATTPYIAAVLTREGRPGNPRSWYPQATVEAALSDLRDRLDQ